MDKNDFSLRGAQPTDLPAIIALDQEIFGWYGAQESPEVIGARLALFPEGFVVLTVADTVVGYLSTEKWATLREPALDENPYTTHSPDGHVLNISTLAVHTLYQGHGLGKTLLTCATDIARQQNCTQIVLETAHAAEFYVRAGFERIGLRTQRGISLHVLRLAL